MLAPSEYVDISDSGVPLVREDRVPPEKLLILTFSNEAANELQERIRVSLGEDVSSRLLATTFHGFGMVLLHALGHHAGLDVDFSILDEICQEELLMDILGEVECEALIDIKNPSQTAAEAVRHINYLKDRLISLRADRSVSHSTDASARSIAPHSHVRPCLRAAAPQYAAP